MTRHHPPGAAPVSRLSDLTPLEQRVVMYTRLWSDGRLGQAEVWRDLIERYGPAPARFATETLETLLRQIVTHGRRPLQRHAPHCPCVGGDECIFARFVALAAEGAREDAILMATLMVRADISFGLARAAEEFGLALRRVLDDDELAAHALVPLVSPTRH
ncbi:hypothetical protein [Amaricoccus sp.]|uniref:hypothetical protein n=1 Tax=Amaricoccus sp. TaxID=1872485 RepID=UPI002630ECDD|nr:hypothetical protein [uncultured Amaricoccus sp.]